jgi:hypothetical protein
MNSDPTRKVLLDVADGPEGITIYTSEDRAVVDWAEQCPALYLSASLNDAHVNLGPFTLLRDPVIAALTRNFTNPTIPFEPMRPLGPDWTHESAMRVHSAIVVALEDLGWHPCPAIKAAWTAVGAIATEYKLVELENLENHDVE